MYTFFAPYHRQKNPFFDEANPPQVSMFVGQLASIVDARCDPRARVVFVTRVRHKSQKKDQIWENYMPTNGSTVGSESDSETNARQICTLDKVKVDRAVGPP